MAYRILRKSWKRKLKITGYIAGGIVLLGVVVVYFGFVLPFWGIPFNRGRHGKPPITPPWALECWLWEDDRNNAAAVTELLDGYAAHDIPVRTIMIDSPWSTRFNDFQVDESRYPRPAEFFTQLQERGYRVVLWMTPNVFEDLRVVEGPVTFTGEFPLDEYPAYIRDGAAIPMNISRNYTGMGDKDSTGLVTWNLYSSGGARDFMGTDNRVTHLESECIAGLCTLRLDGDVKPHSITWLLPGKPTQVLQNDVVLQESVQWRYDPRRQRVIIRNPVPGTAWTYRLSFPLAM